jgi:hypothetical protein
LAIQGEHQILKFHGGSFVDDSGEEILQEHMQAWRDSGKYLWQSLCERAPAMLAERRAEKAAFEERLAQHWGKALDLLEVVLTIAEEAGDLFNTKYRPEAAAKDDKTFDVLTRLQARACLVGSEILALLRSGHAHGAYSRWRTLHEVKVVGMFVAKYGQDVAERYLEHRHIESYKGAEEYQQHAIQLGFDLLRSDEMEGLRRECERLKLKYGEAYLGTFGWARDAVCTADPKHKGNVTLQHLEQIIGVSRMRPYYRMASYGIHPSSVAVDSSMPGDASPNILLTGPSNAGLEYPGYDTCISLYLITDALVCLKFDVDFRLYLIALDSFVKDACQAFLTAGEKLENDHNAIHEWRDKSE